MGGVGSGRPSYIFGKETTDDYRSIDIRRWQRDDLLVPSQSFTWKWLRDEDVVAAIHVTTEKHQVTLTYKYRSGAEEWRDECYSVTVEWTSCNYGGERPWFLCPARGCGRRVAILYGGRIFACRTCYDLAYPSQREQDYGRAGRQADKIRQRLGWEPGILNGNGWKPKGMHWKTFHRLTAEHDALANKSLIIAATKFGIKI